MTILLATNNENKWREIDSILTEHSIRTPREIGVDFAFEESGTTFRENALGKARALHDILSSANTSSGSLADVIVADDSGLCVDALGGRPGIRSARYGSANSAAELSASERNERLIGELGATTDRRAHFNCCMVAFFSPDRYAIVQESFEGEIARFPSGSGGFGYDPIFVLPERGVTAAELPEHEKNLISHRGKATRSIAAILELMNDA